MKVSYFLSFLSLILFLKVQFTFFFFFIIIEAKLNTLHKERSGNSNNKRASRHAKESIDYHQETRTPTKQPIKANIQKMTRQKEYPKESLQAPPTKHKKLGKNKHQQHMRKKVKSPKNHP